MRTEILLFLFFVSAIKNLKRDSLTYLGMSFDKHMNLHHAASHALNPLKAAIRSVMLKLAP